MSEILNNIWSTLSSPEHNKTQSSFEDWQSNFFESPDVQNNVYNYLKENKLTVEELQDILLCFIQALHKEI